MCKVFFPFIVGFSQSVMVLLPLWDCLHRVVLDAFNTQCITASSSVTASSSTPSIALLHIHRSAHFQLQLENRFSIITMSYVDVVHSGRVVYI